MDPRRLRVGEWAVGAAGLVLLASLFLAWYDGRSGWEALGALDVILALIALAAIAVPVVTAAYRVPAVPLALESLVTLTALVAVVLVLFRVLNLPDWAHGREGGVWLALGASLALFAAGLAAMRDERMGFASQPEIETIPPPRPEAGS